jgi:cytochrome c-type biogenesis protein CcmF
MASVTFVSKDSMHYKAYPLVQADSLGLMQIDDTLYAQNLFVRFLGVADGQKVKIGVKESQSFIDFVTVKSYIFPYINMVWLGLIVMALGITLSMINRMQIANSKGSLLFLLMAIGLIYMFLLAN